MNAARNVILLCSLWPSICWAQPVTVATPWPFSVTPPPTWTRAPTLTGNSRVKFVSPDKTAECAVIVKEVAGLRAIAQSDLDQAMIQPVEPGEVAANLSARFNNVTVLSTSTALLSGHPAQLANSIYSMGSPSGEAWTQVLTVTAATPGFVWTVTCGGMGANRAAAEKAYSHWQFEVTTFHTHLMIQRGR